MVTEILLTVNHHTIRYRCCFICLTCVWQTLFASLSGTATVLQQPKNNKVVTTLNVEHSNLLESSVRKSGLLQARHARALPANKRKRSSHACSSKRCGQLSWCLIKKLARVLNAFQCCFQSCF